MQVGSLLYGDPDAIGLVSFHLGQFGRMLGLAAGCDHEEKLFIKGTALIIRHHVIGGKKTEASHSGISWRPASIFGHCYTCKICFWFYARCKNRQLRVAWV